jgi:hypothetical protein
MSYPYGFAPATIAFLFTQEPPQLLRLIASHRTFSKLLIEPEFWQTACQNHFQHQPFTYQDPYHAYLFNYLNTLPANHPTREQALVQKHQNYNELLEQYLANLQIYLADFNPANLEAALQAAKKASTCYGTPGHLLLFSLYQDLAQQCLAKQENEQANQHCQQALYYLYLANHDKESSACFMQQIGCEITSDVITENAQLIIAMGNLTTADIATVQARVDGSRAIISTVRSAASLTS